MRSKRRLPLSLDASPCLICCLVLVGILPAVPIAGAADSDPNTVHPLRVAFSALMFTDVNANDAKASVKAWSQQMAEEMDVRVQVETRIEEDPERLRKEFCDGLLECISLTTVEYLGFEGRINAGPILLGEQDGGPFQKYILLVRADGGVQDLAGLENKKLTVYENPRTCLALRWLDLELQSEGHSTSVTYFVDVSASAKLSQAVLPVFFGQADACLVNRSGFETMVELNPQVGRSLREIAVSPEVVPMLLVIRDDVDPVLKKNAVRALLDADRTASGRQLLTLFQTTCLGMAPDGCFDTARALLAGELPPSMAGNLLTRPGGTRR